MRILRSVSNAVVRPVNPYLSEPSKGMELIAKLLPRARQSDAASNAARSLKAMLTREVMPTLRVVELEDAVGLNRSLVRLGEQIMEHHKVRLLKDKTIVGIGGKFSAGKSKFINSLLDAGGEIRLPENIDPTTSIPTYIVGGEQSIFAYTRGARVPLDVDAMNALTHEFKKKYSIGFARFVNSLVIHAPSFPKKFSDRIALLDTPGYSKADGSDEFLTDRHLADMNLRAADFLIWLVSIDNGTITEPDIQFIERLELETPTLIVLNKADKRTPSDCRAVLEDVRRLVRERELNVFGVTAYSSSERKEYFDAHLIDEFFDRIVEHSERKRDVPRAIERLMQSLDRAFRNTSRAVRLQRESLDEYIAGSEDIHSTLAPVRLRNRLTQRLRRLEEDAAHFERLKQKIDRALQTLTQ